MHWIDHAQEVQKVLQPSQNCLSLLFTISMMKNTDQTHRDKETPIIRNRNSSFQASRHEPRGLAGCFMISDRVVGGSNSTAVSSFISIFFYLVRTAKNFKVFYMFTDDLCTCTPKELIIKPCRWYRRGLNNRTCIFFFFFSRRRSHFHTWFRLGVDFYCPQCDGECRDCFVRCKPPLQKKL